MVYQMADAGRFRPDVGYWLLDACSSLLVLIPSSYSYKSGRKVYFLSDGVHAERFLLTFVRRSLRRDAFGEVSLDFSARVIEALKKMTFSKRLAFPNL